jgi:uncharacterized protein YjiS (DUF1127 family)
MPVFLIDLFTTLRRRRRCRDAVRMLQGLSDRALSDIGLDRSSIADVEWHDR